MEIIIRTLQGTYIVPIEKQPDLQIWLQQNAILTDRQTVREQFGTQNYSGPQLITG